MKIDMFENIWQKLKKETGTTMVETLTTVVLIGFMGTALVAGIAAIQNSYSKIVRRANEQVLMSTTITEMRNMIRHSKDDDSEEDGTSEGIEGAEDDAERFSPRFQSDDGYWFEFYNSSQGIKVRYYMEKTGGRKIEDVLLVPEANGKISGIYSSCDKISPNDDGTYTITGLSVGPDRDNEEVNLLVLDKYIVASHKKVLPKGSGDEENGGAG